MDRLLQNFKEPVLDQTLEVDDYFSSIVNAKSIKRAQMMFSRSKPRSSSMQTPEQQYESHDKTYQPQMESQTKFKDSISEQTDQDRTSFMPKVILLQNFNAIKQKLRIEKQFSKEQIQILEKFKVQAEIDLQQKDVEIQNLKIICSNLLEDTKSSKQTQQILKSRILKLTQSFKFLEQKMGEMVYTHQTEKLRFKNKIQRLLNSNETLENCRAMLVYQLENGEQQVQDLQNSIMNSRTTFGIDQVDYKQSERITEVDEKSPNQNDINFSSRKQSSIGGNDFFNINNILVDSYQNSNKTFEVSGKTVIIDNNKGNQLANNSFDVQKQQPDLISNPKKDSINDLDIKIFSGDTSLVSDNKPWMYDSSNEINEIIENQEKINPNPQFLKIQFKKKRSFSRNSAKKHKMANTINKVYQNSIDNSNHLKVRKNNIKTKLVVDQPSLHKTIISKIDFGQQSPLISVNYLKQNGEIKPLTNSTIQNYKCIPQTPSSLKQRAKSIIQHRSRKL